MNKDFLLGDRVVLKSFNNTNLPKKKVREGENYWLLIGATGIVALLQEVSSHKGIDEKRVLVQFDKDVSALGLHCHNEVPNSLWILVSDLERQ